jgi:hypothetical protein
MVHVSERKGPIFNMEYVMYISKHLQLHIMYYNTILVLKKQRLALLSLFCYICLSIHLSGHLLTLINCDGQPCTSDANILVIRPLNLVD